MEEIENIVQRYNEEYVREFLDTPDAVSIYALAFYQDVAEIYDAITRIKNTERNPTGFSLNDAPVLGLLVRIWKLLKQALRYYEEENAEFTAILERPIIEASVVATYLLSNNDEVTTDYRRCSYKDRLRILRDLNQGSEFLKTKAGQRLVHSVREKLDIEGLNENSFDSQKKNKWRLQGKSFYNIFDEVVGGQFYASSYGMMSESIHGSWNESVDWCLTRNDDGTFDPYPFFHPPDIRYVTPLIRFTTPPYQMWLTRIDAGTPNLLGVLEWVDKFNAVLFRRFDQLYDG